MSFPTKASLAMTLAHELSHIALGHRIDTRFAFNDRFFFPDQNTFQRMDFSRNPAEEEAADNKAMAVAGELSLQGQAGQRRPVPESARDPRA